MLKKPRKWISRRRLPLLPEGSGSAPVSVALRITNSRDSSPARTGTATDPSDRFLDRVLQLLGQDQQRIIEEHTTKGANDIAAVVTAAQDATAEKRKICEASQWTLTSLGGREIKLRRVADKIISLLDKFKAVGDVASNADPIHAGLPWAGIRLILEVAVSEHRQMCALLCGMEIILYMAKRLQAYMAYLDRIPACLERKNFEDALVGLHACVLSFLARAIQAFGKSTLTRVVNASLSLDTYTDFQDKCLGLAERAEIEAHNCDRVGDEHHRQELAKTLMQLEKLQISVSINRDQMNLISKLPVAEGAEFDSYDEQHLAYCYPDTRVDLLQHIYRWSTDPDGKTIFWLNGMAGTGKSTISRTVAKYWQDNQRLGASFFFKRGEGNRGNGKCFFTTLVFQLFENLPELRKPIASILESSLGVSGKSLHQQFEKLFLKSFEMQNDPGSPTSDPSPAILVVDALDECEISDMTLILSLLRRGPSKTQLRIFLTSRPELPIRLGFGDMEADRYQDLILHQIAQPQIEHDIMVLVSQEFDKIRTTHAKRQPRHPLPHDWPNKAQLEVLVQRSVPLFIFAVTVCRFIADDRGDPFVRLDKVLQQQTIPSKLDQTYLPVLEQLCLYEDDDLEMEEIKRLLGVIAVLQEPLPIASLARLLALEERDVARKLDLFHSVLRIPDDPCDPIRLFHLSFREFLVQKDSTQMRHDFAVSEEKIHKYLASKCLDLLTKSLHRDMCSLEDLGRKIDEVPQNDIADAFPPDISYACRYWTSHICEMTAASTFLVEGRVLAFLRVHFLHWLESLSLLGQSTESLIQITSLLSKVNVQASRGLRSSSILMSNGKSQEQPERTKALHLFLEDARRFTLTNRYIMSRVPLQLYSSCLLFAPDSSIVKDHFVADLMLDLEFLPKMTHDWSLELQRLETGGSADYVVFSPAGITVATASTLYDSEIILWDATTGRELLALDYGEPVKGIAFSPDGTCLLSASDNGHVHTWKVCDGSLVNTFSVPETIGPFACHPNFEEIALVVEQKLYIYSIATSDIVCIHEEETALENVIYSPDGCAMAFFFGKKACIQAQSTARERKWLPSCGHVETIAFSHDCTRIVVGYSESTVRIWSTTSMAELLEFRKHSKRVNAAAFSLSGDLVATGCQGATIFLWQAATGKVVLRLEGHDDGINALSFSRDETMIASASSDGTARIWNTSHAEEKTKEPDARFSTTDIVNLEFKCGGISFSSDGRRVAAGFPHGHSAAYETSTAKRIYQLDSGEAYEYGGQEINLSPNGKYLYWRGNDIVIVHDLDADELLWKKACDGLRPSSKTFSPDSLLMVLIEGGTLIIVSAASGEMIYQERLVLNRFGTAAVSGDNQMLAYSLSSSTDTTIYCRDLQRNYEFVRLIGHEDRVRATTFSKSMQHIASASNDRTVRLWQTGTGSQVWRLDCQYFISQMSFSEDQSRLVTDRCIVKRVKTGSPTIDEPHTKIDRYWIQRDGLNSIWLPHLFGEGYTRVWRDMIGIMTPVHADLILIKFRKKSTEKGT